MPELPEVETVRRVLCNQIVGLEIEDISLRYKPIIEGEFEEFKRNVVHKKIEHISRLGKYLIFQLNNGNILSHLRMEGKYFYVKQGFLDNKHIHLVYYLSNGFMLCYQDVRKFGRIAYRTNEDLYTTKPLSGIGDDPILSKEIEIKRIYDKIIRKSIPIKTVLLDQSILCGLGNIYVDEILYQAGILPTRLASSLSIEDVERIVLESKMVLQRAIELKGTTIRSYTSSLGVEGEYQNYLKVHTRKICPSCNQPIEKIKLGGRGTYFCKNCQR